MLSAARFFALHLPFVYSPSAAPSVLLPSAMLFSALSLRLFPSRHPTPAPSNTIPITPSLPIPPSHARTVKHHPHRPVFPHPAILFPHRPFPSPMLHSSPSSRPARPPSFSFPVFPPVSASRKRNSKKLQKNAKKVLTNRGRGGIISKLSAREQPLQQRRPPLPHSGRTLKIKQCMTERNT